MFKEFFSTLRRNKIAFFLNVIGLSVAFTVLSVIVFQVTYDFGYDRSYKDLDRLYNLIYFDKVGEEYGTHASVPLAGAIGTNIPGIEAYTSIGYGGRYKLEITDAQGNKKEYTENYNTATPGFFSVFSPEILAGDPKTCLDGEYSAALPQSIAVRLFGNEPALGKSFKVGNSLMTVSLVYKDFPKNSSINNAIIHKLDNSDWSEWSYVPYLKLVPGVTESEVINKIAAMDMPGMSKEDRNSYKERLKFELTPMKDLYFNSKMKGEDVSKGNLSTTLSLIAIAILITGIAYVNFINFSTALAPVRIKRINTQKVMGAMPGELRRNIIFEAVFISLIAYGLSFVWTLLFTASPAANFFTADLTLSSNVWTLIYIGLVAIAGGVVTGCYPAFYMTSFPPAMVLKGSFALTPKGTRLRNSLLLFQFITTIVLITVASFIKIQHSYMQNMGTGFDRENIVYVSITQELRKQKDAFLNELTARPEISDYTLSRFLPGQVGMQWGRDFDGKVVQFYSWPVGHNFLRFFNIKIAEGTDFFAHNEKGVNKIIFNRKFIDKFGIEDVIGKEIGCFRNIAKVVGVAENINFNSVRDEVEPMAFVCGDDQGDSYILLKVSGTRLPETMDYIRKTYKQFSVTDGDIGFLDQRMARLYQKEENFAKLISIFGFITILISLMGIYGLIIFNARFKLKEIGVRKVNGGTEAQMLVLLNKGFLKLILFSFIIAVPIAWYIVNQWLAAFPYRTTIYWWVFLLAGIVTLIITMLTVSYQSWKAANVNPVDILKSE